MKIALITDIHYGVRQDSPAFLDANKRFFDNVFFPYLKEHNITTVVCLGDLLDRRKFVNYNTAKRLREEFIEPVVEQCNGGGFIWILGNHDIYFKHSLEVSAAYELARDYPLGIVHKPRLFLFDGLRVLMVPWITEVNKEECYKAIAETDATILMGHFEIQGFEMYKGVVSNDGENEELFRRFHSVLSGHFHHRHSRGNIHYLGASGDYSWADYGDSRGFHIFDTEKQSLEFIPNPYSMFARIYYDDGGEHSVIPAEGFDFLNGKSVKLNIIRQTNAEQFSWFMTQLEAAKPLEIRIINEVTAQAFNVNSAAIENKDTLTVIRDCIAMSNTTVNTQKLENLFISLYREAQDVE